MDLDSRVEKAQINAKQINKLMKGDAQPVFTRYDDGRPAENLFNKEGLYSFVFNISAGWNKSAGRKNPPKLINVQA